MVAYDNSNMLIILGSDTISKTLSELILMGWKNAPKRYEEYIGFVYCITEIKTNKKYIGIKKFWTKKKKETDWKSYVSSSGKLKGLDVNNSRKFKKEITHLCKTVTELKTTEAYIQLTYYMTGRWNELYNEMINIRLRIRK